MTLLCRDLFKLPSLKNLKQIGGENERNRPIKWVYKVNYPQFVKDISQNIQSGDLVIISGKNKYFNIDRVIKFIKEINSLNASGLIICSNKAIDYLTYEVVETIKKLRFPLFYLRINLNEESAVVREICKAIIIDNINRVSKKNILEDILDNKKLEVQFVEKKFRLFGLNIDALNQIGIVVVEGFENTSQEEMHTAKEKMDNIYEKIKDIIKNVYLINTSNAIVIKKFNSVIFLIEKFKNTTKFEHILFKIDKEVKKEFPDIILNFGLGGAHSGIKGINNSYYEAEQMIKLKRIDGVTGLTEALKNMDVYLFLIQIDIKNRKLLYNYAQYVLEDLISYEKTNQIDLMETLDAYLNENANIIEASDKLFIHKNTLKYRLKKIENLLNVNLHSLEDCLRLLIAMKAYKIINIMSDNM
ncbi:MAG: helix-turn-helix domain-containing protein [Clostridium luticellarii]|jgi:sugar diacid utilization regulator|uniref:helix-turn-helix domain-containing protein n=1 Tax=Clostridium luticellarii TaxID=1691940 RepID=UPI002357AB40|nr:helix-turn-helix domain-containing protein [Clostridium luticellarii]MCI1946024.1 helix-turn-helix domain-containing protein [Clostridium luticellarii]MCI2040898.1 helix-turn-helix domain-containing protein [Clostridium luticellarii]